MSTNPDLITDVAKYKRGWTGGGSETPCGFGSKVSQTTIQREWIPRMVGQYGIHSISDIGAGDLNWIPLIQWPHPVQYTPFDLVPRHQAVQPFDIIQSVPKASDLILCLWVLNHFPEDHARQALKNIQASGSKYLMLTYEPRQWDFTDLPALESVVIRKRNDERGNVEIRLIELARTL